jgi:uncharacterized protein (DUF1778 family)
MTTTKKERIEIRSSPEEKRAFEEAALLVHMQLSDFIRFAAHRYAEEIRKEYQNITLSKEEGLRFLKALENPPEPNEKLKKAMRAHEKNVKK